jgi:3-hydroxyacyl-CoA dehydrogenase
VVLNRGVLNMAASRVQRVVQARADRNTDLDQEVAAVGLKVVHKVDLHRDLRRVDLVMSDLVEKVGLKETVVRAARQAKVAPSVAKLH